MAGVVAWFARAALTRTFKRGCGATGYVAGRCGGANVLEHTRSVSSSSSAASYSSAAAARCHHAGERVEVDAESCSSGSTGSGASGSASNGNSSDVLRVRHPVMILQEWAQRQGDGNFTTAFEMMNEMRTTRPRGVCNSGGSPSATATATASRFDSGEQWWTTLKHRRSGVKVSSGPYSKKKFSRRECAYKLVDELEKAGHYNIQLQNWMPLKLADGDASDRITAANTINDDDDGVALVGAADDDEAESEGICNDEYFDGVTEGAADSGVVSSPGTGHSAHNGRAASSSSAPVHTSAHPYDHRRDARYSPVDMMKKLLAASRRLKKTRIATMCLAGATSDMVAAETAATAAAAATAGNGDDLADDDDSSEFFERYIESRGNGDRIQYVVEVAHRPLRPLPQDVSIKIGRAMTVLDAKMMACHRLLASLRQKHIKAKEEQRNVAKYRSSDASGVAAALSLSSACNANRRNLEALMGDKILDVLAIFHLKLNVSNSSVGGVGGLDAASIGNNIVGNNDNTLPRSYSDFLARRTCNEALAAKVELLGLQRTGKGVWQDATLVEQHVYKVFIECDMDVMEAASRLSVLFYDTDSGR